MINRLSDIIADKKVFLFGEESYIRRLQSIPGLDLSFVSGVITEEDLCRLEIDDSCVIAAIARLPQKYVRILKSKGVNCPIITNRYFGLPESNLDKLEFFNKADWDSPLLDIVCSLNAKIEISDLGYVYKDAVIKLHISAGFNSEISISGATIEEGVRIFVGSNSRINIAEGTYIGSNTEIIVGNRCELCLGTNILLSRNSVISQADCCDLTIGNGTTMGPQFECYAYAPISIGEDCMLSSNIFFGSGDGHDIRQNGQKNHPEPIVIGRHTWIGKNASILKGTDICGNSIVGTGTIVKNKKTTEPMIIYGNPNVTKKEPFTWDRQYSHYLESRESFKKR